MVINAAVPQTKESRFYAGLYLRTRKGTRFWGWGQPELNEKQDQSQNQAQDVTQNEGQNRAQKQTESERPWASLAEWLRQAHSSTFAQNGKVSPESSPAGKAQDAERASPSQQPAQAAGPGAKRRLRFVWDRKFIGFVIR